MNINKRALLEWLKNRRIQTSGFAGDFDAGLTSSFKETIEAIQSGRFDVPPDDRLRAALERIRKITKESREAKYHVDNYLLIEMVAEQALSTTTEPTGPSISSTRLMLKKARDDGSGNTICKKCFTKIEGGYCNCHIGINAPEKGDGFDAGD